MSNLEYVKFVGNRQISWDASSLEAFKRCPTLYNYRYLQEQRPSIQDAASGFGTLWHKCLEIYDTCLFNKLSSEEALKEAVSYAVKNSLQLKPEEDSNRNYFTLIRGLVWYHNIYKDSPLIPIDIGGAPALEIRLETPIPNTDYKFVAKFDKIAADDDGKIFIVERKTSKKDIEEYRKGLSPGIQTTAYLWILEQVFGIKAKFIVVDLFQTLVEKPNFGRIYLHKNEEQIKEWFDSALYYINLADNMQKTSFWPMNEATCKWCDYRDVCSSKPRIRKDVLKHYYTKPEKQ